MNYTYDVVNGMLSTEWVLYLNGTPHCRFASRSDLLQWVESTGATAVWKPHWAAPPGAKIVGRVQ